MNNEKKRCRWCNQSNPLYVEYHDHEWGIPLHDDYRLFEILLLETFQSGLSWECVLRKREAFRLSFDNFDFDRIACYDASDVERLMNDPGIIRNRRKIEAAVSNARAFIIIREEYGSFDNFIWSFTGGETLIEYGPVRSLLSDRVARELKQRGMRCVGSVTIYAYLQAIGVINAHEPGCFMHRG